MADLKKMQIGQIVDFVIAYNERQKKAERLAKHEKEHGTNHKASQDEINAFFG